MCRNAPILALALVASPAVAGCSNEWRTDMWYQPSYRAESSPRPEPEGSLPLGGPPPMAVRDDTEDLPDPVPPDAASTSHGRAIFAERCVACHGPAGRGEGPVSKFFPPGPDLAYPAIKARTPGYVFGTITFGGQVMPPLGDGLTVDDRWDVVNFVRSITSESK